MADDRLQVLRPNGKDAEGAKVSHDKEMADLKAREKALKKNIADMKQLSALQAQFNSNKTYGRIKSLQESGPSSKSQEQSEQEASDKRVREAQLQGLKTAGNAIWKGIGNFPVSAINGITDFGAAILHTNNALKIDLPFPYDNAVEAEAAQDVQNVATVATAVVGAVRTPRVGGGTYVAKASQRLSPSEHKAWLEKNGYRHADDHVKSADPNKPVETVTLQEGEEIHMYVRDGGTPGSYGTVSGSSPESLAIDGQGRHLEVFRVNQPVEAVRSTAAEFPSGIYPGVGGPGGGLQYQLPAGYQSSVTKVR